jgi:hypothetical protein
MLLIEVKNAKAKTLQDMLYYVNFQGSLLYCGTTCYCKWVHNLKEHDMYQDLNRLWTFGRATSTVINRVRWRGRGRGKAVLLRLIRMKTF